MECELGESENLHTNNRIHWLGILLFVNNDTLFYVVPCIPMPPMFNANVSILVPTIAITIAELSFAKLQQQQQQKWLTNSIHRPTQSINNRTSGRASTRVCSNRSSSALCWAPCSPHFESIWDHFRLQSAKYANTNPYTSTLAVFACRSSAPTRPQSVPTGATTATMIGAKKRGQKKTETKRKPEANHETSFASFGTRFVFYYAADYVSHKASRKTSARLVGSG